MGIYLIGKDTLVSGMFQFRKQPSASEVQVGSSYRCGSSTEGTSVSVFICCSSLYEIDANRNAVVTAKVGIFWMLYII